MKLINQKTMKKISLQTKLEDCFVPQRYIDAIKRGSEDVRTTFDLVSLTIREFLSIRTVGKRCLSAWDDFLEQYGLHIGMTIKEIRQYEPDGIIQYNPESGKMQYKTKDSLNCNPESNIDREQGQKFDPKTLKPFDKVLGREHYSRAWRCNQFSHIIIEHSCYPYKCYGNADYKYCIPYNDETKHLVGTKEEAPEFYRYWED